MAHPRGPKPPARIEIVGVLDDIDAEDSGQAMIGNLSQADMTGADKNFFLRLHSWNRKAEHKTFESLRGKRLRITIEVIG